MKLRKPKSIGTFLKSRRIERGLTQAELAKALGYSSPQFVSNWERGLCLPPLNIAPILVEILATATIFSK